MRADILTQLVRVARYMMETGCRYHLYTDGNKEDATLFESSSQETDSTKDRPYLRSFYTTLSQCVMVSFTSTVLCGVFVGFVATVLWWVEFNVRAHCFVEWDKIPSRVRRQKLVVGIVEALILMFWPLLCIIPVISWSTARELNLPSFCIIAGLVESVSHSLLYIFGYYGTQVKSYIGNVLFLSVLFCISYKVARMYIKERGINTNVIVLTLKLGLQFILGLSLSLFLNYIFFGLLNETSEFYKFLLTCILIFVFFLPKLILTCSITNANDIYTPGQGILFAVAYLTCTTVIARLAQSKIDKLPYFVGLSVVHGVFNIIDKLMIPLREKICRIIFKREASEARELYVHHYIANQSLISIITETTSIVFNCWIAYVLYHFYEGDREVEIKYASNTPFNDWIERVTTAVSTEFVMNVVALIVQIYLRIPVVNTWKEKWRFILVVHVIQIFFFVVYFSEYLNDMLIKKYGGNTNMTCIGFFDRL